jgi:serine/threonine protein kinase
MSELRCRHCGIRHDERLVICPATGLPLGPVSSLPPRAASNTPRPFIPAAPNVPRALTPNPAVRPVVPPVAAPRAIAASPKVPEAGPQSVRKLEQRRDLVGVEIGGKYRIKALLGQGGMGAVYEAEHVSIGRVVAVKVLHPKHAQQAEAVARLRHEARVAGNIGHPNICETYDLGRLDDGSPYLVMERLVGETLDQRIKREGALPERDIADVMLQVLSALGAAHDKGIIHRDLKPENVFLMRRAGSPAIAKLLDFGISKAIHENRDADLTMPGIVMGTPYYMAPEQARGDRGLDHRVDIWAAGVILYEALTGRRPFVARNYNALLVQILTSKHRPLSEIRPAINASIERIVDKALAKMREDRFQTALEFRETLRRVIDPEPPPQSLRSQQQPQAPHPTQPARMSFSSEPEDDETVVLSLTHKEVAVLAAARNSAPMSNRQGAASYNFDKRSAPGVPNAPAPPRPPGSSLGDRKTMPMGPQDPPAAEQAERVAWLPPPPPSAEKKIPPAKETPLIGAVHFDNPPSTQRAPARLPERLNFDDDDGEDERTLVDPPSFSGDRTTLVRPFPPPSGKGR